MQVRSRRSAAVAVSSERWLVNMFRERRHTHGAMSAYWEGPKINYKKQRLFVAFASLLSLPLRKRTVAHAYRVLPVAKLAGHDKIDRDKQIRAWTESPKDRTLWE